MMSSALAASAAKSFPAWRWCSTAASIAGRNCRQPDRYWCTSCGVLSPCAAVTSALDRARSGRDAICFVHSARSAKSCTSSCHDSRRSSAAVRGCRHTSAPSSCFVATRWSCASPGQPLSSSRATLTKVSRICKPLPAAEYCAAREAGSCSSGIRYVLAQRAEFAADTSSSRGLNTALAAGSRQIAATRIRAADSSWMGHACPSPSLSASSMSCSGTIGVSPSPASASVWPAQRSSQQSSSSAREGSLPADAHCCS
mmetsp:Transcript_8783/g.22305  ORF Transcript_8783/g.22305 Transcript_8783/m.22305 type:complete len:256 (+) Transcript_8783:452-1219(+)